jgi:hypothetical protein
VADLALERLAPPGRRRTGLGERGRREGEPGDERGKARAAHPGPPGR